MHPLHLFSYSTLKPTTSTEILNQNDIAVLRELATKHTAIASHPSQEKTRRLRYSLNHRDIKKSMFFIYQMPWNRLACHEEAASPRTIRLSPHFSHFLHIYCDIIKLVKLIHGNNIHLTSPTHKN